MQFNNIDATSHVQTILNASEEVSFTESLSGILMPCLENGLRGGVCPVKGKGTTGEASQLITEERDDLRVHIRIGNSSMYGKKY